MVFHYFGSKLGLYEYLMAYADERLEKWFGGVEKKTQTLDYIEQYRLITKLKLKAYTEEPHVFEFFAMLFAQPANLEGSPKVHAIYQNTMEMRTNALVGIRRSQNTAFFRGDIDTEKAKKYIGWLVDGYTQNLMAALGGQALADMELDCYWDEFDELLDDMKRLFYRPKPESEQEG